mmetsp:Transcript_16570/g.33495  ORF Transcript_16570/g.33495 Transcript_16570/m.33495 type:complete len:253 (-) Transcript_16570:121-879(-)
MAGRRHRRRHRRRSRRAPRARAWTLDRVELARVLGLTAVTVGRVPGGAVARNPGTDGPVDFGARGIFRVHEDVVGRQEVNIDRAESHCAQVRSSVALLNTAHEHAVRRSLAFLLDTAAMLAGGTIKEGAAAVRLPERGARRNKSSQDARFGSRVAVAEGRALVVFLHLARDQSACSPGEHRVLLDLHQEERLIGKHSAHTKGASVAVCQEGVTFAWGLGASLGIARHKGRPVLRRVPGLDRAGARGALDLLV